MDKSIRIVVAVVDPSPDTTTTTVGEFEAAVMLRTKLDAKFILRISSSLSLDEVGDHLTSELQRTLHSLVVI
jgi:hypothetical protein